MGILDFLFSPIEPAYVTRRKQRSTMKPATSGVLDPLLGLLGLQPVQPKYTQRRRLKLVPGPKTPPPRSPKPPKDTSP